MSFKPIVLLHVMGGPSCGQNVIAIITDDTLT